MSGRPPGGSLTSALSANELAKATFRRLARSQLEPTPENYARAYALEAGSGVQEAAAAGPSTQAQGRMVAAAGVAWAQLAERLLRNLDRSSKQWTLARRKDSLKRVFEGSRSDAARLLQRLQGLMKAWEDDVPADAAELGDGVEARAQGESAAAAAPAVSAVGATTSAASTATPTAVSTAAPSSRPASADAGWAETVAMLEGTLRQALPLQEPTAAALAQQLCDVAQALARDGATAPHVAQTALLCTQARVVLGQRHQLVQQLSRLCRELSSGLAEIAEDGSWVQGSCEAVVACLQGPQQTPGQGGEGRDSGGPGQASDAPEPNLRAVRDAAALLAEARQRQRGVRGERQAAQQALKSLIQNMLLEVGELGAHTGRFQTATAAHAQAIEGARSMESLAGVVQAMLADSREVQAAVQQSSSRLNADRDRAGKLESKVHELESELRRLSDEVSTDTLTQVANRRGLAQVFEMECARQLREGGPGLSVGLIDIDNFKKLNDTLGHAAGDLALKNLAAQVQSRLRPTDHLARYGGEEFVVLIPGTPAADAQQALTRLQRNVSEALFLHEGREVFVTFSAGVTNWQPGETLEEAVGRADTAMYEAKRTGKNRTCKA